MSFAVEPWFVPDTTALKEQLNQFLKRKAQMALVVDEYGEVQGLITLEDILEEIVGQIADEHDTHEAAIRPQPDGTVNVDGTVAIRDLNRHMDWSLPDEEATTIAGLVIHEAQTIPEPGQVFTFYGYRFEVLRKTRNKITALRISPAAKAARARGWRAPPSRLRVKAAAPYGFSKGALVQARFRRSPPAWAADHDGKLRKCFCGLDACVSGRRCTDKGKESEMNRAIPMTIAAGVLACALAAGSAQAAPASGILGKLAATANASTQVEQAGWRGHHNRCFRRCMWRTDGARRFCWRKCHRWGW